MNFLPTLHYTTLHHTTPHYTTFFITGFTYNTKLIPIFCLILEQTLSIFHTNKLANPLSSQLKNMESILAAMTSQSGNITLSKEQLQQLINAMSAQTTPEKKTVRKTSTKDPHAPTRAKTPYTWRGTVDSSCQGRSRRRSRGKPSISRLSRWLLKRRKTMSDQEKEHWNEMSVATENVTLKKILNASKRSRGSPAPEGRWAFWDRFIRGLPKMLTDSCGDGKRVSKSTAIRRSLR